MPNIKKSYGIICCRRGKEGVQIMMVKKSTTYHFCEFVAGHYRKHNETHLAKLFNNMTYHEKMDILSMKFQTMWYRIYRENPDEVYMQGTRNPWASSYIKKKSKFESTFMQDGGARLKRLIEQSNNVDTEWEFPKGRKNSPDESHIDAASREFSEETGVDREQFKILWHVRPYVSTYDDFGTTYQNTYYYAEAIGDWEPVYRFYNKHQISEVSAVRWVTKSSLLHMNLEAVTYNRLVKSFEKAIKKYKNSTSRVRDNSAYVVVDTTSKLKLKPKPKPNPKLKPKPKHQRVTDPTVPRMNFVGHVGRRTYGSVVKGNKYSFKK